jgi:hypothetical protein
MHEGARCQFIQITDLTPIYGIVPPPRASHIWTAPHLARYSYDGMKTAHCVARMPAAYEFRPSGQAIACIAPATPMMEAS